MKLILVCLLVSLTTHAAFLKSLFAKDPKAVAKQLQENPGAIEKLIKENPEALAVQPEEEIEEKEKKKGFLGSLKSKFASLKSKITGKAPFVPKDALFKELLKTFAGFPVMTNRVQQVYQFASELSSYDGSEETAIPVARTTPKDYPSIRVLAAALATNKKNMAAQLALLVHDIQAHGGKDPEQKAKLLWKYLALCAIKMTPMAEWHKKSLKELFKPAAKLCQQSGRDDWFGVPITKVKIVHGLGKGKLPWAVEPRTANDLLNGVLVLMSTSGHFRPLTANKALMIGWEEALLLTKNFMYAEAVKDLLNRRLISAVEIGTKTIANKPALIRELMILHAQNLEKLIREGASSPINPLLPRNL